MAKILKFGINDLIRVTDRKTMHGWPIGKVVAVARVITRKSDGTQFYQAVDADGRYFGLIDEEVTLVEKWDPNREKQEVKL